MSVIGCTVSIATAFIICYIITFEVLSSEFLKKSQLGRGHCGIVTANSSGGDIDFNAKSERDLIDSLKRDYYRFRYGDTFNNGHTAEYKVFTNRRGQVKIIGYITKEKVVFEGREYYFPEENITSLGEILLP